MKRSTIILAVLGSVLLSGGATTWLVLQPAQEAHRKFEETHHSKVKQKKSLEIQVQELQARLKQQAIDTLTYFDLRKTGDKRREIERKTVETLATLTEIFNDRHMVVQTVLPKAEVTGFKKPIPTPSPVSDPVASVAVSSSPPSTVVTPPPASLLHKSFQVVVRGEYEDIVEALQEIEALPKAISINQYEVAWVRQPGEAADKEDATLSASALELRFEFSITFLLDAPSSASVSSRVPQTGDSWFDVLCGLLVLPAEAAELDAPSVSSPPVPITEPSSSPSLERGSVLPVAEATPATAAKDVSSSPAAPLSPATEEVPSARPSPSPIVEWGHAAPTATPRSVRRVRPRVRRSPPVRSRMRSVSFGQPHQARRGVPSAPAATPTPVSPNSAASQTQVIEQEPSLRRAFGGAYHFPISRDVVSGRRNPFVPLMFAASRKESISPDAQVPSPPQLPGAASSDAYVLGGVLLGGGAPMAVIQVGEDTLTVGIQGVLPGGARVVAISSDYVVLDVSGRRITLKLPR